MTCYNPHPTKQARVLQLELFLEDIQSRDVLIIHFAYCQKKVEGGGRERTH